MEPFVPPDLRARRDDIGRRARLLVVLAFGVGGMLLLSGVISSILRGPNMLGSVLLVGAVGCVSTLGVQWRWNTFWGATFFLTLIFLAVSFVAWAGYGFLSPALHAMVLFPMFGVMLGGGRLALPFTLLPIGQMALLFAVDRSGIVFPLARDGSVYLGVHLMVQSACIAAVNLGLYSYNRAWEDARAASEAALALVESADQAKSEFLAHMSHEMRTPLSAVLGYIEMLQEDARTDQEEDLQRVHAAGRHLLHLVDEVLDLARIEAGHLELQEDRVPSDGLLREVADEVRPLVGRRGNTLRVEGVAPLELIGDRVRFRQILLNLLSNASKFTEHGTITLRMHTPIGDTVRIDVEDTGVGMEADALATIFEPFVQSRSGRGQGTGLGLAISRSLAVALGGDLTVRSVLGEGTCFTLTTRCVASAISRSTDADPPAGRASGRRLSRWS